MDFLKNKWGALFKNGLVGLCAFLGNLTAFAQVKFVNQKPFDNQYFIQNDGQFSNRNCDFAIYNGFDNVYINQGGSGFVWDVNLLQKIQDSTSPETLKKEEKHPKFRVVTESVDFKLINTLPNAKVLVEGKSNHYFSFGQKEWNSFGYKKITYRNIYKHIDVVYEIGNQLDGQIKYSFILHPGARVDDIKIQWNGNGSVVYEALESSLQIKIDHGNFVFQDHKLKLTTENQELYNAKYVNYQKYYGFHIEGISMVRHEMILDPFVKRINIFKNDNSAAYSWTDFSNIIMMSDYDNNNNLYLMSATLAVPQLAKFDQTGKLLWIFSGEIPSVNWSSGGPNPGCFLVDKQNQRIYMTKGRDTRGDYLVRFKLDGNWDQFSYHDPSTKGMLEAWDLQLNCEQNRIIVGGGFRGFNDNNMNLWGLDLDNITQFPNFYHSTRDSVNIWQDVVCSVSDLNSEYYSIVNFQDKYFHYDSSKNKNILDSSFYKNTITKLSANLDSIIWQKDVYGITLFQELWNTPNAPVVHAGAVYSLSNRNNCLAINRDYLFVYDGKALIAFNKANGSLIGVDSVKHHTGLRGHYGQSGIAVDDCNRLFIGGDSARMLVYHFNAGKFQFDTSIVLIPKSNRATLDVRLNKASNTLFVSGDSFTAAIQNPYSCKKQSFEIDSSLLGACQRHYSASVKWGDTNLQYIFRWTKFDHNQDSILREVKLKVGQIDTFYDSTFTEQIQLLVQEDQTCNPENYLLEFNPQLADSQWVIDTFCNIDSLVLRGRVFRSDTFFLDRLTNRFGCDSLVWYRFYFHRDTAIQINYKGCDGDTFEFSGVKYTESAVHVDRFFSSWGCDSVVTRTIQIDQIKDTQILYVLCKNTNFTYSGRQYAAPNHIFDTLQSQNGCDSFVHIELIPSQLSVDFEVDSAETPLINFFNKSQNQAKLIWHFGDGKTDTTYNSSHKYNNTEDREIEVCLQVVDSFGCRDTLCRKVNIYRFAYLLYNAFSPNDDGINDIHRIGYKGKPFKYNLYIYNRWGALVYQTEQALIDDATQFWNGQIMNTGPDCPDGNYFIIYEFFLPSESNLPKIVEGVIQLIR